MTVGVPAEGPCSDEDGVGRRLPMELVKGHHMRLHCPIWWMVFPEMHHRGLNRDMKWSCLWDGEMNWRTT